MATHLALRWLLALGPCVAGCGPSVQSIYEGNVRFEHCYRLDLDPAIAPPHREACWREWLQSYTYGQTTDRIEYARRRLLEIKLSPNSMVLRMSLAAPAQPASAPPSAPGPTTTHEPPPPTLRPSSVTDTAPSADRANTEKERAQPADSQLPPGHDCTSSCGDHWRNCQTECTSGQGIPLCDRCAPDYRRCVRRCYE